MKTYLALGLLSSLLLTSCSVDWNDAKEKRIGELEKQVVEMKKEKEDDFFKKNQECLKYKNEISKEIKKEDEYYQKEGFTFFMSLDEIFYSKEDNTCIAIISKNWAQPPEPLTYDKIIKNILTNTSTNYRHGTESQKNTYDIEYLRLKGILRRE